MSDTLTIRHCRTAQANATLNEALDSALAWLDDNQSAEKEECDSRRKELEMVAAPLWRMCYRKHRWIVERTM